MKHIWKNMLKKRRWTITYQSEILKEKWSLLVTTLSAYRQFGDSLYENITHGTEENSKKFEPKETWALSFYLVMVYTYLKIID